MPALGATHAVIIAHGVNGRRGREFIVSSRELVEQLVAHGFSVLMIDLRGHGESAAARMTYGIRERRDVLGAVDWLLARGYAPGMIGVIGLSMGGVAGIGAAREEPAIGALVVDSACADFLAMMRIHFQRFSKLPLFFFPGTLLLGGLLTGENLARLRPADLLRGIGRRPVMIIHASGDRLVPVDHAQSLALAGEADLWISTSTSHLGTYSANPQIYSQRVAQFLRRTLVFPRNTRTLDRNGRGIGSIEQPVFNTIHTSLSDERHRRNGHKRSVHTLAHVLEMRWWKTSQGLRLRWIAIPTASAIDQHQISNNTNENMERVDGMIEEQAS